MDMWTDGQMDRQMDRRMDRQTDQIDRQAVSLKTSCETKAQCCKKIIVTNEFQLLASRVGSGLTCKIRLGRPMDKRSSLFVIFVCYEEKSFITSAPNCKIYNTGPDDLKLLWP
jgi:hypothetical protein